MHFLQNLHLKTSFKQRQSQSTRMAHQLECTLLLLQSHPNRYRAGTQNYTLSRSKNSILSTHQILTSNTGSKTKADCGIGSRSSARCSRKPACICPSQTSNTSRKSSQKWPTVHKTFALQKDSDVILFGGEFLDVENDKMYVKSELYRFHTADFSWTKITVPNGSASPYVSSFISHLEKRCHK